MSGLKHILERFGAAENLAHLELDTSGCAAISISADRTLAVEQSDAQVLVYVLQAVDHEAGPMIVRAMRAAHHQISPGRCVQTALRTMDNRLHLLVLTRISNRDLDERSLRDAISSLSAWLDTVAEAH